MRIRLPRLAALFRRRRFEEGMDDELRFHIDAYVDDLVQQGLSRPAAARRARLEFGGVEAVKEELRQVRGLRIVDELRQDARYAVRTLRRGPAAAVIAVLALGIGMNVAVFGVVHAALLRPLPHPDPGRLVAVFGVERSSGRTHMMSADDVFDMERRSRSFERLGAYYPPGFNLTGGGSAERVPGGRISSGLFEVFGVRPALGRGFLPAEDRPGAQRVAVISHAIWTRRFQQDRGVLGRPIVLSGIAHTIVGVLPAGFESPAFRGRTPEIWVPLGTDPNFFDRGARALRVFGRLRPGVAVNDAVRNAAAVASQLRQQYPETNRDVDIGVISLHEQLTGPSREALVVLTVAVVALLIVAATNAASLLLGWTLRRRPELAMRMALGAGRGRIVRQVATEGAVLAIVAAAAGFAAAWIASDAIVYAARTARIPRATDIHIGGEALLVAVVLAVTSALLAAMVAALAAIRSLDPATARVDAFTRATPRHRSRACLIAAEAALSLALLAGAGLLLRSFIELRSVDPGLDASDVLATTVSLPAGRYPEGPVMVAFYERMLARIRAIPGVEAAAVVDWLPLGGTGATTGFSIDRRTPTQRRYPLADLRVVSTDYFRALRIPLNAGRTFDERDHLTSGPVVVINQALAQRYFGAANPLGRYLIIERDVPWPAEIIGVVGNVRQYVLQDAPSPEIFAPKMQQAWMTHVTRDLVIRAASATVAAPAAAAIRDLDADIPVGEFRPMSDVVDGSLRQPRVQSLALLAFAVTAMVLAAFGIYGAVAASVTERTRELGVRLALGAPPVKVMWGAATHGAVPALAGLAIGVPMALAAGRLLRGQLFAIGPADVPTLLAVTLVLAAVGVVAAVVPAWRATRIDPVLAIRTT